MFLYVLAFTLIEKKNQVFKKAKFEFMVTVHFGLWAKCFQLWPLKLSIQTFVYDFKLAQGPAFLYRRPIQILIGYSHAYSALLAWLQWNWPIEKKLASQNYTEGA